MLPNQKGIKMDHEFDCECAACKYGIENVKRMEQEAMEKEGWYAHIVQDDPRTPYGLNYHTHGMVESFDHPDLQVVLKIDPRTVHSCIHNVVKQIKAGKKFKHGDRADEVIRSAIDIEYQVMFVNAVEGGRNVLRVIFPDAAGNLEPQDMDPEYGHQHCNPYGEE